MKACQGVAFLSESKTRPTVNWDLGRSSKYSNYLPPYFLMGIVNFPNGNFDNFDLCPPPVPSGIGEPVDFIIA